MSDPLDSLAATTYYPVGATVNVSLIVGRSAHGRTRFRRLHLIAPSKSLPDRYPVGVMAAASSLLGVGDFGAGVSTRAGAEQVDELLMESLRMAADGLIVLPEAQKSAAISADT